jgi:hypothetical protein
MKRIFELDFTELSDDKRPGYGFQSLVREIGFQLRYDVKPGGTGADEGKDLVFDIADKQLYESTVHRLWLVSCKDFSVSGKDVTPQEVTRSGSIKDRATQHKCAGFLLACTTYVTDDTRRMLDALQDHTFATHIWDGDTIRRILHEYEEELMLTLIRFFPKSYASTLPLLSRLMENLIQIVEGDEADVQFGDIEDLVGRVQDLSSSTHLLDVKQRLGEAVLWRLDRSGDALSILYPLLSEWVQFGGSMSKAFVHALLTYLESYCLPDLELAEDIEELELDKESGAALSQQGDQYLLHWPLRFSGVGKRKNLIITIVEDGCSGAVVEAD